MNEKATTLAVKDEGGMVLIEFPHPVRWCELDPETARQVGEFIARASYKARYGTAPPDGRSVIAEAKRDRLVVRVAQVLRNLQDRGRSPKYSAQQIVDIVLAGVS